MAVSDIEWTEATWNPIAGCSLLSPGCTNCYAMRMAARLQAMGMAKYTGTTRKSGKRHVWTGRVNVDMGALNAPLAWKKPQRIFVNSMSDLFQDKADESLHPSSMASHGAGAVAFVSGAHQAAGTHAGCLSKPDFPVLPNVWLGTSVESEDYLRRIDLLRRVPARIRFVSFEPLLGPIMSQIYAAYIGPLLVANPTWRAGHGGMVGGAITRCLRQQGVVFFFKQWGGKRKKRLGSRIQGPHLG